MEVEGLGFRVFSEHLGVELGLQPGLSKAQAWIRCRARGEVRCAVEDPAIQLPVAAFEVTGLEGLGSLG